MDNRNIHRWTIESTVFSSFQRRQSIARHCNDPVDRVHTVILSMKHNGQCSTKSESIRICSWPRNGEDEHFRCMRSIFRLTALPIDVIIIDYGYTSSREMPRPVRRDKRNRLPARPQSPLPTMDSNREDEWECVSSCSNQRCSIPANREKILSIAHCWSSNDTLNDPFELSPRP